jgi:ribonucleoside-triphosphate reductase
MSTSSTLVDPTLFSSDDPFQASASFFETPIQQFQFMDKYSRFNHDKGRRETWIETVDRAVGFLRELSHNMLTVDDYESIRAGILRMDVLPSMRLLAMAGPAARRSHITLYNCSYVPVDALDAFVEALIISMSGGGVGFSVEWENVKNLPQIVRNYAAIPSLFCVEDSAEGWAEALRHALTAAFAGIKVEFDFSQVRPAGAILKTKGGRASGPEPLKRLLGFVWEKVQSRAGQKLRPIDAHDLMCMVGSAAVSGGMRRTAMLSLFDADDAEMRAAKDGAFWIENPQRWNANNSAVWTGEETYEQFSERFDHMIESGRGEPGIFNRAVANRLIPPHREKDVFGTNPCGEIILKPMQFCNLSAVVARSHDTPISLMNKIRLATVIGTIQSMADHFPGLRPQWKENAQKERLLGVDITGQMDCPAVQNPYVLKYLREYAVAVNKDYAAQLGINKAAAVTCVKPSGNSAQLVNCASGIHARWAPHYLRNVRVSAHSPVFKVFQESGVPVSPENGQDRETADTFVVGFPVKSPEGSITRHDRTAIEQCNYWYTVKAHYTDHNPSVTITYKPHEVEELKQWVWDHLSVIGGMTFLPAFDADYPQLPYVDISEDEYNRLSAQLPPIDWSLITKYEQDDNTTASQQGACESEVCSLGP